MLGAYWGFVLISLHLGIHWSVMMSAARRLSGPSSKRRTLFLRFLAAAVAAWGIYGFLNREIGSYLLMRIQFAFFDFEEPLIFFFADYLAIMGLFVCVGHYLAAGIKSFYAYKSKNE